MWARIVNALLGPTATAAKQALFGPVAQLAVYAPAAIWLITHREETLTCATFGQAGVAALLFAWIGWILTRRTPRDNP